MRRIFLIDCPGVVYPSSKDSETDKVLKVSLWVAKGSDWPAFFFCSSVWSFAPAENQKYFFSAQGVVRVENISQPEDHVEEVLRRVKPEYISRTYGFSSWSADDHMDFLEQLAKRTGRLLKGGEPDICTVSCGKDLSENPPELFLFCANTLSARLRGFRQTSSVILLLQAAKMVLHDWQRGRLPYFVPPPAKNSSGAKGPTGASQSSAALPVMVKQQPIGRIPLSAAYDDEDLKRKSRSLSKRLWLSRGQPLAFSAVVCFCLPSSTLSL